MKKIFVLILASLLLTACQTGTSGGDDDNPGGDNSVRYIKNSQWETVRIVKVSDDAPRAIAAPQKSRARSMAPVADARAAGDGVINEEDLKAEVLAYNLANTDDQQTILEEDVPIEESPYVDVYMCDPVTHEIKRQYLQWERTDYVDRNYAFVTDSSSMGWVLYVDQIPPAPIIPDDTRTPYEKYALYLIAADGSIIGEEHCADGPWKTGGWVSVDAYFTDIKFGYELQSRCDGKGEYVVAGRIYTPPEI